MVSRREQKTAKRLDRRSPICNRTTRVPPAWASSPRCFDLAQCHLEAALGAGPPHHRLVPALDVGVVGEADLVPLMPPGPAEDREIGDRHLVACRELRLPETLVEDAVKPVRFLRVALEAVTSVLLLLDLEEVMHLSRHRPEPAHLPHQPFQHRHLLSQIALRPELAGLLAEINQDRARFENADRLPARPVAVEDRRDPVVRADLQEFRLELLTLGDVDRHHLVGQPHLFDRDADLATVRRVPSPQFDGHQRDAPVARGRKRPAALPRWPPAASRNTIARRWSERTDEMSWQPELEELRERERQARELGGADKVKRQHDAGKMTVRERVDGLVDEGSFHEVGAIAGRAEYDADGGLVQLTPSNCVMGRAEIDGRPVVVVGDDFTVRGGSADATIREKPLMAEQMAHDLRLPIIRIIEGSGGGGSVKTIETTGRANLPGRVGSNLPYYYTTTNLGLVPVVALGLGSVAGLGAARMAASHYSVMTKETSALFVSGPRAGGGGAADGGGAFIPS